MRKIAAFAVFAIVGVVPGLAQTEQTDSQTLQGILTEMRGIHNDLRLGTTSQILLTELSVQQTAVDHAMQRRDDAQSKLSQVQLNQKNIATQLANIEANATSVTDSAQVKQLQQFKDNLKAQTETMKAEESQRSNEVLDADGVLRKAQLTLEEIRGQLNDVVKKLQPAAGQ
jgi:hypothetical protein